MEESEIEDLLFLVMENETTSASSSGLKQRARNRLMMRAILQLNLGISDDEIEEWHLSQNERRNQA